MSVRSISPALVGGLVAALAAAGCRPGGPPAAVAPAATATLPGPVFDAGALATLEAIRGIPDFPHLCAEDTRDALAALAADFPREPLVVSAAREIMPRCRDYATLAELLEEIPEAERTDADRVELAQLYSRNLSRFADAEAIIAPVIERNPTDLHAVSIYAAALYYQGRFKEAAPLVDALWEQMVNEQNVDILTIRADAFIDAGQVDRAIRILDQVLGWNPQHGFALNTMRKARVRAGDDAGAEAVAATREALDEASAAKQRVMTEIQRRFQDLVAAFDAHNYDEAAAIALELIEKAPDEASRSELYQSLGNIRHMQGRDEEALAARDEATRLQKLADATRTAAPAAAGTAVAP